MSFLKVKNKIVALSKTFNIPIPEVNPPMMTDRCDFTSPDEIRVNVRASNMPADHHACHVFAHYLCDMHAYSNSVGDDTTADQIADVIGSLLKRATDV
jgi:hypothetical protein